MSGRLVHRFTVALAVLVVAGCTSTSSPSPPNSPLPSLLPGQIAISCDDPYPGHCLGLVAFAAGHLPAGHAPIASITATAMAYPCPSASPCEQPPHRGDSWAAFILGDGQRLGMWVAQDLAGRRVQSVGPDLTPPASAGPPTVHFVVGCGTIADGLCLAIASGGVISNTTTALISVARSPASTVFDVTYDYVDGSILTVEVGPDVSSEIGWAPVPVTR